MRNLLATSITVGVFLCLLLPSCKPSGGYKGVSSRRYGNCQIVYRWSGRVDGVRDQVHWIACSRGIPMEVSHRDQDDRVEFTFADGATWVDMDSGAALWIDPESRDGPVDLGVEDYEAFIALLEDSRDRAAGVVFTQPSQLVGHVTATRPNKTQ